MAPEVTLSIFTRQKNEELYEAYLRIKYRVFVDELGWRSLVDDSAPCKAKVDPFDDHGLFMTALSADGVPVGVIRGTRLKDAFPHRDLFEPHLGHPVVAKMFSRFCTLNALAVLPAYRGKSFRVTGCESESSIAKLLVLGIIRSFEREGLQATIATAQDLVALFFQRLGFQVLDRPGVTRLHKDILTNVGLVFGSPAHLEAQARCHMGTAQCSNLDQDALDLVDYFEMCQSRALGSNSLESFFKPRLETL